MPTVNGPRARPHATSALPASRWQCRRKRALHARLKARVWRALDRELRAAGLPCEALPDGITVEIGDDTDYEPDAVVNWGEALPDNSIAASNRVIVVERSCHRPPAPMTLPVSWQTTSRCPAYNTISLCGRSGVRSSIIAELPAEQSQRVPMYPGRSGSIRRGSNSWSRNCMEIECDVALTALRGHRGP